MSNNKAMDKQILVYPYNIIVSDKNESTVDRCSNMDEFQNDYAEWWKKPENKKEVHAVHLHVYKNVTRCKLSL